MRIERPRAGYVRGLVELPHHNALEAAAKEVLAGGDPEPSMRRYEDGGVSEDFIPEKSFGAIPTGEGLDGTRTTHPRVFLEPKSQKYLLSGEVKLNDRGEVPDYLIDKHTKDRYQVHSNPLVGELWDPPRRPVGAPARCVPTCGTSEYVGDTGTVRRKLRVPALEASGLDGHGVGIAIVDSGIFGPRLARRLGDAMDLADRDFTLDNKNSWRPLGLPTEPGKHRVGHGTMCAYDALIAAPQSTLLDVPMLLARPVADHHSTSMVDAAMKAYIHLMQVWSGGGGAFDALVVSNSWGLFHPCLEDFPPGHPFRFIDNPYHFFHSFTRSLSSAGVDIVFCGNNCGDGVNCTGHCASGTCLSQTQKMIMGANTYEHVLTIGGCDTNDALVGYSSRGPSIDGMYPYKPDLVAYTHFLGSRVSRIFAPDTGVSAACPVAAGCVAALRSHQDLKPSNVSSADLFQALRETARRPPAMPATGWDGGYGYGVIDPVAAARKLGVQIP